MSNVEAHTIVGSYNSGGTTNAHNRQFMLFLLGAQSADVFWTHRDGACTDDCDYAQGQNYVDICVAVGLHPVATGWGPYFPYGQTDSWGWGSVAYRDTVVPLLRAANSRTGVGSMAPSSTNHGKAGTPGWVHDIVGWNDVVMLSYGPDLSYFHDSNSGGGPDLLALQAAGVALHPVCGLEV